MSTSVGLGAGTNFGKYRITRLLGKGGMGQVYEAYDTAKDRTVALKILADQPAQNEQFRTRFLRESHAAAALQEPHIIPIHDWGEIHGTLYIDMRLVRGKTLQDLLDQGSLAPSRAVAIVNQIAAALDAAHTAGLIHRDIKPQNIIVTEADFAYLVDFGIAVASEDTRLTRTATAIGSFAYMAPERFGNEKPTPAVDIYSLACVLYQSLTGRTPFPDDSMEHVIAAHMTSPPPRPSIVNPNVPTSCDDVIARGMAKHPDDRYGSAGALARAAGRAVQTNEQALSDSSTGSAAYAAAAPTMWAGLTPQTGASTTGPPTAPSGQNASRRQWVLPTVIATAAALLLGGIGIVIGLLAAQSSKQPSLPLPITAHRIPAPTNYPTGTSPAAPTTTPPPSQPEPPPSAPPAPPPPAPAPQQAALPPLVHGPDPTRRHESCDGYALTDINGWGSHSGRGTPETSCFFARSVLAHYWDEYGNASRQLRTISAPGSVSCTKVAGAQCEGSNFRMECVAYPRDNWITCTGGNNARVYLY